MRLKAVRVKNFKCIKDSSEFSIDPKVTCLVGKNESGKTAILQALAKLNPTDEGLANFSEIDEFPRHQLIAYREQGAGRAADALFTTWELSPDDVADLVQLLGPSVESIQTITLTKRYDNKVGYALELDERPIVQHLIASHDLEDVEKYKLTGAETVVDLRRALEGLKEPDPTPKQKALLASIQGSFDPAGAKQTVFNRLLKRLPKIAYFAEYLRMPGQLAVQDLKGRQSSGKETGEDKVFLALLEMIGRSVAAPHDSLAVPLFKEFLEEVTKDPEWSDCETWLVDTGDLTSLGDQDSLDLGRDHLNEFAQVCPKFASIYGNHDAWPGKLPLLAAPSAVMAQSQVLVARKYVVASPQCPLRTTIPHGDGEVQLYFADSIIHDQWRNTWALGEISDTQLAALKSLVDQNYDQRRRDFRILAVHHPVHYPPPRPGFQMAMRNDRSVAAVLDTPSPAGAYPLAHLVLSGHTHYLYPPHGGLPAQPSLCIHPHLGDDQCQFVVGSLMQLDRYNKRLGWPHQCQILRLHFSESQPAVLSVDRLLAARQAGEDYRGTGIGPYKFVRLRRDSEETAEEISFAI